MRVLVIEDDRETAQFLRKALKESGHAADIAEDGETGLSKMGDGPLAHAQNLVGHEAFAAALLANSIGELGGHRAPSSHQFPLRQFGLASEPSHSDLVLKGALFSPFGALFSPFNEEER
jgi:CheY-like chemotaxis protein